MWLISQRPPSFSSTLSWYQFRLAPFFNTAFMRNGTLDHRDGREEYEWLHYRGNGAILHHLRQGQHHVVRLYVSPAPTLSLDIILQYCITLSSQSASWCYPSRGTPQFNSWSYITLHDSLLNPTHNVTIPFIMLFSVPLMSLHYPPYHPPSVHRPIQIWVLDPYAPFDVQWCEKGPLPVFFRHQVLY